MLACVHQKAGCFPTTVGAGKMLIRAALRGGDNSKIGTANNFCFAEDKRIINTHPGNVKLLDKIF